MVSVRKREGKTELFPFFATNDAPKLEGRGSGVEGLELVNLTSDEKSNFPWTIMFPSSWKYVQT